MLGLLKGSQGMLRQSMFVGSNIGSIGAIGAIGMVRWAKRRFFCNFVQNINVGRKRIVPKKHRCKKRVTPRQRMSLWHRDNCQCQVCGVRLRLGAMELDHIKPRVLGGQTRASNLRVVCNPCHRELTRDLNIMLADLRNIKHNSKKK